jgi:hypothetical protein
MTATAPIKHPDKFFIDGAWPLHRAARRST